MPTMILPISSHLTVAAYPVVSSNCIDFRCRHRIPQWMHLSFVSNDNDWIKAMLQVGSILEEVSKQIRCLEFHR